MKNQDHARFAEWDAAYVLGALSPAERREFEYHLDGCEKCRAAVTELSALPGLLGRIDDARAFALLEDAESDAQLTAPDDLLPRILSRERRDRIRRRIGTAGALLAAAAVAAVLALVLPPVLAPAAQPSFAAELTPTDASIPLDASIALTSVAWGTRIEMDCSYHPGAPGPDGGYAPIEYALWVVDRKGRESPLSSWTASAGGTVSITADTALALADIAQVEVRSASGVQVLLQTDVGTT